MANQIDINDEINKLPLSPKVQDALYNAFYQPDLNSVESSLKAVSGAPDSVKTALWVIRRNSESNRPFDLSSISKSAITQPQPTNGPTKSKASRNEGMGKPKVEPGLHPETDNSVISAMFTPIRGVQQVAQGVSKIASEPTASGKAGGVSDVIRGLGKTASPYLAPAILENPASLIGLAASAPAQSLTERGLLAAGVSPEMSALGSDIAGMAAYGVGGKLLSGKSSPKTSSPKASTSSRELPSGTPQKALPAAGPAQPNTPPRFYNGPNSQVIDVTAIPQDEPQAALPTGNPPAQIAAPEVPAALQPEQYQELSKKYYNAPVNLIQSYEKLDDAALKQVAQQSLDMQNRGDVIDPAQLQHFNESANAASAVLYQRRLNNPGQMNDPAYKYAPIPPKDIADSKQVGQPQSMPVGIKQPEAVKQSVRQNVPRQETLDPKVAATLAPGSTRVNPMGGVETLMEVPVQNLRPTEGNQIFPEGIQKFIDKPELKAVAPEARAQNDGTMRIWDGHHRVEVAKASGEGKMLAWVSKAGKDNYPEVPEPPKPLEAGKLKPQEPPKEVPKSEIRPVEKPSQPAVPVEKPVQPSKIATSSAVASKINVGPDTDGRGIHTLYNGFNEIGTATRTTGDRYKVTLNGQNLGEVDISGTVGPLVDRLEAAIKSVKPTTKPPIQGTKVEKSATPKESVSAKGSKPSGKEKPKATTKPPIAAAGASD